MVSPLSSKFQLQYPSEIVFLGSPMFCPQFIFRQPNLKLIPVSQRVAPLVFGPYNLSEAEYWCFSIIGTRGRTSLVIKLFFADSSATVELSHLNVSIIISFCRARELRRLVSLVSTVLVTVLPSVRSSRRSRSPSTPSTSALSAVRTPLSALLLVSGSAAPAVSSSLVVLTPSLPPLLLLSAPLSVVSAMLLPPKLMDCASMNNKLLST